mgnify:CR=1 FL=1
MPFKDTKEGSTHYEDDPCPKCKNCKSHYMNSIELHQHLSESIQCNFKEKVDKIGFEI